MCNYIYYYDMTPIYNETTKMSILISNIKQKKNQTIYSLLHQEWNKISKLRWIPKTKHVMNMSYAKNIIEQLSIHDKKDIVSSIEKIRLLVSKKIEKQICYQLIAFGPSFIKLLTEYDEFIVKKEIQEVDLVDLLL